MKMKTIEELTNWVLTGDPYNNRVAPWLDTLKQRMQQALSIQKQNLKEELEEAMSDAIDAAPKTWCDHHYGEQCEITIPETSKCKYTYQNRNRCSNYLPSESVCVAVKQKRRLRPPAQTSFPFDDSPTTGSGPKRIVPANEKPTGA